MIDFKIPKIIWILIVICGTISLAGYVYFYNHPEAWHQVDSREVFSWLTVM